ncbi:1996_t:CDS:2 [Acaulospora morrowiae]|uniref:1996_t:CDS:1 n=1 Tax=Acaulospora morrowiae TaxID=94023 RepID=A0A9N9HRL9_9GLOM|nr:1996_t:CDS:2 [Acaulospora morrowiae]
MPRMKDPRPKKGFFRELARRRGWGYPDILRFGGSVLPSCAPITFFSVSLTTAVTVLYMVYDVDLALPDVLIGSVSVVVGLLLAFRTNNAYDRYYEGRKLFNSMCTVVRNCTRETWVGIIERDPKDHIEKEKYIKLLLAYVVAVKHHLRLEFGTEWFDLQDLLPEGFQLTYFDGNAVQENADVGDEGPENHEHSREGLPCVNSTLRTLASRVPPTTYNYIRTSYTPDESRMWFGQDEWGGDVDASMSLPLEIVFHLGLYFNQSLREGKLEGVYFGNLCGGLNSLIDILGNLERIGNTPIPFAYNVHLKQAVSLYVWSLPFALVSKLEWFTIPVMLIVSLALFGVEAIGAEIENPFGYDKNDLPLDDYCKDLEAEIKYLQRHLPSKKDNLRTA